MLVSGGASSSSSRCSIICSHQGLVVGANGQVDNIVKKKLAYVVLGTSRRVFTTSLVATTLSVLVSVFVANAVEIRNQQESETLSNIPQMLSGECISAKDCKKPRIQRPKSRKAESCTTRCVKTCIYGGDGSFNVWRPTVVFRQGFRSRQYCLVECSDICNLIGDGEDGF